jgi:hypothetical protein
VFPAVDAILLLVPHEDHVYIRNCSTSLRSGFGAFASQMAVSSEFQSGSTSTTCRHDQVIKSLILATTATGAPSNKLTES